MKNRKKALPVLRRKSNRFSVPLVHSVAMRLAYQVTGLRGRNLLNQFPQYCKATIYNHCMKTFDKPIKENDRRRNNPGRPKILTDRDSRHVIKTLKDLRRTEGSFTSPRVQLVAGLSHVSNRSVRRVLNNNNYKYCRSRKKGLLTRADLKKRLKFCRKIKKDGYDLQFWRHKISFYFDGTGFVYKQNPKDQAFAPTTREWRKPNEGLSFGCTSKGKKEGSRQAKFMVAISYNRGVVMCEQYEGCISGSKFAKLADNHFPQAFLLSVNPYDKLFLQDGDPSQNSAKARDVFERMGAKVFSIPPRSPDLNPIENFFHLISMELKKDTVGKDISYETFDQFSERVKNLIVNFPITKIDKIIDSMERRIDEVIRSKGNRTKY